MKLISKILIVLFFGIAQFSFSQTTCFQADNNYVFEGSSSAKSIAKGDFNNDGHLDIIMGNSTGASSDPTLTRMVYIQNNGGRSFSTPINFMSGSRVLDVAVGDIDNDGNLDVVLVNFNMDRVAVVFGNGDGTFQTPIGYTTSFGPNAVVIDDFDGDGYLDVAVIGNGSNLDVFLNDSGALGTLLPQTPMSLGSGVNPTGITSGDLDADGIIDLAIANSGAANATVLTGDGFGAFSITSTIPTGLGAADIVADDFDNDGVLDLAVVNTDANNVSILINDGFGNFASAVNYVTGLEPVSIETGDFDNDGQRDLAIVNTGDNTMSTLNGIGDGTFTAHVQIQAVNSPQDLVVGDFDVDGNDDVIHSCSVGEVMPVYYGIGNGDFDLGNMVQVGSSPRDITTGDFDNDLDQDFAVVNYNDNTVSVYSNDGSGNYIFAYNLITGNNPSSITSGDFNGNGNQDIIVTNYTDGTASVFLNIAGTFSEPVTVSVNAAPIKVRKGDFNKDGSLDLFVVNEADQVTILPGDGAGSFLTPIVKATGSGPKDIAVGDLEADGDDDFVVSLFNDNSIAVFKSDGVSGFTMSPLIVAGTGPVGIALGDFNNDGKPEIVSVNQVSNQIKLYVNNGAGAFSPLPTFTKTYATSEADPIGITTGDFNGDGNIDVAVTHKISVGTTGYVVFYVGAGNNTLTKDSKHAVGINPIVVHADDLDNNGSLDLAVVNESSDYVSIMLSSGGTPVISAGGSSTICGSGSVTLTSTSAATYLWSNGETSQSITVSTAGTYFVTTSAPGGGCSAVSNSIIVSILPSPTLSFTGTASICIGNPTAITVSGADNYVWSDGLGTAATQNLNPVANKTYTVVGTNANGCTDTLDISIIVNPLPNAGFNTLAAQYCKTAPKVTLTPATSGGVFSGTGVLSNEFNPAVAGVGTHTITYSITDGNGCTNSTSQTVDVTTGGVDATFATLASQYCEDDPIITLVPTTSGGTFSGDGVTGNTFDPSDANIGSNTITYSITSGGCSGTSSQNVDVNEMPEAGFNGLNSEYCLNEPISSLIPDQSGGTFSGPGITGVDFSPSGAGVGNHTIVYSITVAGCSSSQSESVEVLALPNATFSGLAANYCVDAASVTLTPTQGGGTFSGPGVTGTTFSPNTAGTGTHTIIYAITDGNGCSASSTQSVTINALPVATFTGLAANYCVNAASVTLTATQGGGTFSGPGVTGTTFDPTSAGTGTHTITYAITDGNGCSASSTQSVTIDALPVATFTGLATDYCVDAASVTLTATQGGGTFSGPGVTGTTFDPTSAGTGTHTITYAITDGNGCSASSTQSVTVDDTYPIATFSGLAAEYCVNNSSVTLTATQGGGTFSGPGVTGTTFDPTSAGVGTHSITYTITGTNTCTSTETVSVEINALPVATFSGLAANYCVDAASVTLTPTQGGGTFSGPGVTGTTFDPNTAGLGTHTITYVITDGNGCSASSTQSVTINALPVATFTGLAANYCVDAASVTLTATQGGGTFSGPGVTGTTFDPTSAGTGTHTITYAITDGNGCSASSTQNVTINALPVATFTGLATDYCVDAASVTLTATQGGGTFSGPGVTGTTFNPTNAGFGTHAITYTITDGNGCSATSTQSVIVTPLSNASFSCLAIGYCIDAGIVTLTPSQSGGNFSGPGVLGNTFNPNTAGVGTHSITYSITDGNGCTATSTQPTKVSNVYTDATFSGLAADYCVDAASVTLTPNVSGGTFSGPGVTGSTFNPTNAGTGIHSVTYTITGSNACTSTETVSVEVNALPVATFSGLATDYCVDAASVTLTPTVSGGIFSGPGVTGTTFDPNTAGLGTSTISYAVTDGNGCSASSTQSVTINALPVATFSGLAANYCVDAASVTLTATQGGGTFSGPGVTGSTFNPTSAGVGTYTITYVITDGNGCSASSTQSVIINALPVATFTGLAADYCVDAATVTLTATQGGGTFSGPGVTGSTFNPTSAGTGAHAISYSITDGNGCSSFTTQDVIVNALPNAGFTGLAAEYCKDNNAVTMIPVLAGGTFTGPGVSGTTFDPQSAGIGNHTIEYTVSDINGCQNTWVFNVEVTLNIDASFTGLNATYCSADGLTVTLTPTISGGVFSGPGVTGNTWSVADANLGNNTIVYEVTNSGCTNSSSSVVNVLLSPNANFTAMEDVYCNNESPVLLVPNQSGGAFTATSGLSSNKFYPSIANIGTSIITYSITNGNGCFNSHSDTVEVVAAPVSTITVNDTTLVSDVSGAAITYQWMNCKDQTPIVEENDQELHVGQNGTYSVVVFDGVCRDTSECVVVYFADLETYLDESSINVYPNPNNGSFNIETMFDAKVEILNAIGQMIYQDEHIKGKSTIDLGSSVEAGMYIVKFMDNQGRSIFRNVIIRN